MTIPFDRILITGPFDQRHVTGVNVKIPQELGPYALNYAIHVLNYGLTEANKNHGRCALFNLITSNNFCNEYFNKAVELSIRLGWLSVVSNQNATLELAMPSSVAKALAYLTSELVLNNYALLGTKLNVNDVNAMRQIASEYASMHHALFNGITWKELNNRSMAVSTYGGVSGIVSPVGMTVGAAGVALNTSIAQTDSGNTAGSEFSQLSVTNLPNIDQTGFVNSVTPSKVGTVAPASSDDLFTNPTNTPSNYGATPPTGEAQQPAPAPVIDPTKYYLPSKVQTFTYPETTTTHRGQHEMDAMTHARAYFGNTSLSARTAILNFQGDSYKIAQDQANMVPAAERLTIGNIRLAITLDDLIGQTRQQHRLLGRKRGKHAAVARVLGVAMNPVFTSPLFESLLPTLYGSDIRDLDARLKIAVDCPDSRDPTPEQHERLVTACYIDRTLGRMTNDFLARGIRSKSSTKMFADSVKAMIKHFSAPQFPPQHVLLLQSYINTIEVNLRTYGTPENIQAIKSSMLEEDENPDDVGVAIVPIAHTITYCDLTTEELEWTSSYNGTDIDGKVTPTLFQLCQTLSTDKTEYSFRSSYDWMLTGDGETYLLYENPDVPNAWRIFPVSGLNINLLKQKIS